MEAILHLKWPKVFCEDKLMGMGSRDDRFLVKNSLNLIFRDDGYEQIWKAL